MIKSSESSLTLFPARRRGAFMNDDHNLPPPMTPKQFIRLLDQMCIPGLARKSKRYGQVKYSVTVDDIETAGAILSHERLPSAMESD